MDILNQPQPEEWVILPEHWSQMQADVIRCAPEEACGLVAGQNGISTQVFPVSNLFHSPFRFRMEPVEQLNAFQQMDERGWVLLGIYHSHPQGPTSPSATDIAEAAYPGVIHLIWYRTQTDWDCQGYLIEGSQSSKALIHIPQDEELQQPIDRGRKNYPREGNNSLCKL